MKSKFVLLLLLMIVASCDSSKSKMTSKKIFDSTSNNVSINKTAELRPNKNIDISNYMSDTSYITWRTHHADTTKYLCQITFRTQEAIYWYHGQCQYTYLIDMTSDTTIDLYWAYKTDCILNMSFLNISLGLKHSPEFEKVFSTYTLINNTTLRVKYYYPEWVKRVNELEKDSLFPTYFYLCKD